MVTAVSRVLSNRWFDKADKLKQIIVKLPLPTVLNNFTIHGLWPKKFPNIEPKCTSKEQFNITKVQKGVQRLEEVWLCLNPKHNFTDCPPIGRCSTNFTFPPFSHISCNSFK
ncbi:uncharacterized protein DC041_0004979 [Schistosoma bovis]|uniref:Uncharacterized protein n=1 Tax=Schistosoma bovis TaxID=6184 RepID=A0A430Q749_SCHBO|nr:uncharacterized protein DC041_0004979 [Schistosoma bovis]